MPDLPALHPEAERQVRPIRALAFPARFGNQFHGRFSSAGPFPNTTRHTAPTSAKASANIVNSRVEHPRRARVPASASAESAGVELDLIE